MRGDYLDEMPGPVRIRRVRLQARLEELGQLLAGEREANRRLRELNEMKSEFASTASHELRTPLAAILGLIKTLRQPAFGEDAELRDELLERSERQAERLMRLIERTLSAALEGEEPRVAEEAFAFSELVDEIAESVEPASIEKDLPPDLPAVLGNRERVGRVLANLVGNAVKYSPEEQWCRVGARHEEDGFHFWVEDRGMGMTKQEIGKAFEPFYQADGSLGGVGLGLHLVRRLLKLLDGQISVTSSPGEGSRFEVTLPPGASGADAGFAEATP